MASFRGSGPNHVEFGKPDFSGGKLKARVTTEGAGASASTTEGGSGGHTITVRCAFGKDEADALANLKAAAVRTPYAGPLSTPFEWETEDDPASPFVVIEYVVKEPDGSLHDRMRLVYQVSTLLGVRTATLRRAIGFEARVIRSHLGYDYYFIWRPIAAEGFVKCKIPSYAVFSKLWHATVEVDEIELEIFDVMRTGADIGAASVLCLDAGKAYLLNIAAFNAAGAAGATKHPFSEPAAFQYCGFDVAKLVSASSLPWAGGGSLAAIGLGSEINYSDTVILDS